MKITIGIPAYNEENNIAGIISKLKKVTDSIIVCDDGSSDMTAEISRNLGAIVISHDKNRGYGAAIKNLMYKHDTNRLLKLAHYRYDETGKEQWNHDEKWEKYCPVCKAKNEFKQLIKINN